MMVMWRPYFLATLCSTRRPSAFLRSLSCRISLLCVVLVLDGDSFFRFYFVKEEQVKQVAIPWVALLDLQGDYYLKGYDWIGFAYVPNE